MFCIIGARIYYVAFEWDYYSQHPSEIFAIRNGGLAIYGGIITAVICCSLFCKHRKINFFQIADSGILGLITGQIVGRWGNFLMLKPSAATQIRFSRCRFGSTS